MATSCNPSLYIGNVPLAHSKSKLFRALTEAGLGFIDRIDECVKQRDGKVTKNCYVHFKKWFRDGYDTRDHLEQGGYFELYYSNTNYWKVWISKLPKPDAASSANQPKVILKWKKNPQSTAQPKDTGLTWEEQKEIDECLDEIEMHGDIVDEQFALIETGQDLDSLTTVMVE